MRCGLISLVAIEGGTFQYGLTTMFSISSENTGVWLVGRPTTTRDSAEVARLERESLAGLPIADLIVELIASPAFLNPTAQELQ